MIHVILCSYDEFYAHMTVHRNRNFTIKTNRRKNFQIILWYLTRGFSAHHQELSTVHSALAHVPVPNVQSITPDDGQRNRMLS